MNHIDVMKQALEALDCIYSPLHVREIEKVGKAMSTLRTAIEQAEKSNIKQVIHLYDKPPAAQPAPVQPAVPLTDEQMREALRTCPHDTVENLRVRWLYAKDFARAIEAAHGITGETK